MTADTWSTRDLPVLRAVVERYDSTGIYLTTASDMEASVGFDHDTVQRALRALNTQPSFFEKVVEASGGQIIMVGPPTGDALRVAGAWPSPENLLERLIVALESAADDEMRTPDERNKLKQAAIWLASFGSQIAISALGGAAGNVLSGWSARGNNTVYSPDMAGRGRGSDRSYALFTDEHLRRLANIAQED